ncbi:Yqey-like protein [Seminavis robusta]|uniref:Yqey-like protein n=1 Tax=Seminavis robusta TaxID=568900 RepID=A0A9N8E700_9STRA|nr:Yqey-like protein [Seminavis robusta]|eukprot:Sro743_g196130.1 Yqey-like protein (180) ;mRNA; r:46973-47512
MASLMQSTTHGFLAPACYNLPQPTTYRLSFHAAIVDEVTEQMKVAMKAKDTVKLGTIRLVRSAFANAAIGLKVDALSDDQAVDVLRKMAKMRAESIDMYNKGGATDRAEAEQAELDVLNQWLPSLADEDQTREWVLEAIEQAGDNSNIGKVMGALMKAHKGEVDGSLAQKVVKEEVAKL